MTIKHFSGLLLAALLATPLVACEGGDGTPPDEVTGTVRGTVSVEGSPPEAPLTVELAGTVLRSAPTGSDGGYTFSGVPGASYTVALRGIPDGVTFFETWKTTSITTDGRTATVDFSGVCVRTSSISGRATAGGEGVQGATVTLDGTEAPAMTTDGRGPTPSRASGPATTPSR